ncbi:MAG: ATP-binding cassette domain-containing protein [Acidobacteriia bacterium]|nr:ATP-binding cassette domain-containing protein [Terriglobia bacterium]
MTESNPISQIPQSTRTYDERLESGVIATRKLTRRFDGLVAVNDLTFSIDAGTIFGLLGPNGAGKSTLIKMLTTLLPPSSGTAIVAGFDILSQPREVRRHIGYVSQMLSADGELTGYENLLISAKLYGLSRSDRAERISQALEFMQLQEAGHKLVKRYSGGMIRRLEIAQSMLHRPPVLFLDEPTVGLDPAAKHSVWQRILDLKKELGTSVLMTTHDMEEADHLCDAIAFMHEGKLLATGSPAELKTALGPSANLDDVFIHYAGTSIAEGGTLRDVAQTRHTAQRLE